MEVNDHAAQGHWFDRLKELGILDMPSRETAAWRQRKMSQTIMSERLLDAEHFSHVEARTLSVTKDPADSGGEECPSRSPCLDRGRARRAC